MAHFKISNKVSELQDLQYSGKTWGLATGLAPLDEIYSIKLGYPLFIAGAPHSGKSEVATEIILNTIILHNFYWVCYFGEGGEVEEIFADMCHKLVGKPYKSGDFYSMNDAERTHAQMILDKHVFLIDDEKDMTLTDFYTEVAAIEKKHNVKINGTIFDPFNDVIDGAKDFGGRDDKWLAHELKHVRRVSKRNNRIDILVNHIADVPPVTDKTSGKRYTPIALPSEWSGGRTWWRRAFVMLLCYRPPSWLLDPNGREYGENISMICVQKAKPKGTAKLGSCLLNWDWQKNKYFWYSNGQATFSYDINLPKNEPKKLIPNNNFDLIDFNEPTKSEYSTEAPF